MIDFDAPFIPDDESDRLNPDGSRNLRGLVTPIKDATGRVIDHEVNF